MKNKVVVIVMFLFIVIFGVVATYFWYHYFLDLGSDGSLTDSNLVKDKVILIDENKVYATYKEGIDEHANPVGYKFKVKNIGVTTARYQLNLLQIKPQQVNDGCSGKTTLKEDELNYRLYLNEKVISEGSLNQLQNDVLDLREINIDVVNDYKLEVWLNNSATDYEGKHYHYKVDLEVIE